MTDDRIQITDAGNQIAWKVHPRNPIDSPLPLSDVNLYAPCSMPFLPATQAKNRVEGKKLRKI
jgi:hypothetical protein